MNEKITFETAMKDLEKIVSDLESGEKTIEENIELYSNAQKLLAFCDKKLGDFERKVEFLSVSNNNAEWKEFK